MGEPPPFDRAGPRDRLVAVGAVLFGIGLLATLITVVPLFIGSSRFPVAVYLVAMLGPVGFGLALLGLLRAARARRPRRSTDAGRPQQGPRS